MTAPELFSLLLQTFVQCFTTPGFRHFTHFVHAHAMLAGVPHCVTETLRLTRWHEVVHWTTPYAFLSRGRFSCAALSRRLLELFDSRLGLGEELVLTVDDTLVKKWGRRFFGLGLYRDPTDKSPGASKRKVFAHCWVVLGLLVRRGDKWMCLPLGALLFLREKTCPKDWSFLTKIDLADRLLRRMGLARRRVILVVDNLYAKAQLIETLLEICMGGTLVSRLRCNAALYFPPVAPKGPRGRGRPRIRGEKTSPQSLWRKRSLHRKLTVRIYGKTVTLKVATTVLVPSRTLGSRPVRVVICPRRSGKPNVFFSTDPEMTPERILELYAARWEIECLFKEVKTRGGFGDYRHVRFRPIKRHATLCLVAAGLLRLIALESPEIVALTREPWWDPEGTPSAERARRALARLNITPFPDHPGKQGKIKGDTRVALEERGMRKAG
jgi:hypothetical protein